MQRCFYTVLIKAVTRVEPFLLPTDARNVKKTQSY